MINEFKKSDELLKVIFDKFIKIECILLFGVHSTHFLGISNSTLNLQTKECQFVIWPIHMSHLSREMKRYYYLLVLFCYKSKRSSNLTCQNYSLLTPKGTWQCTLNFDFKKVKIICHIALSEACLCLCLIRQKNPDSTKQAEYPQSAILTSARYSIPLDCTTSQTHYQSLRITQLQQKQANKMHHRWIHTF